MLEQPDRAAPALSILAATAQHRLDLRPQGPRLASQVVAVIQAEVGRGEAVVGEKVQPAIEVGQLVEIKQQPWNSR